MRLNELASLFLTSRIVGVGATVFSGIQMDSRKVRPGDLFICIKGLKLDGHQYAEQAVQSGAAALVVEHELDIDVPMLVVGDTRHAMAAIAAHFYGYPTERMKVIGVTGTNGKTTTTYLIEQILSDAGHAVGLMGTTGMKINGERFGQERTTPESLDLQANFGKMMEAGTDYCVMEVSSMALQLGRVKGCKFRTAIFTNLTQDHLDDHLTMDRYREAKGLFFSRLGNTFSNQPEERVYAILNADDPEYGFFHSQTAAQVITYGIRSEADVRAVDIANTSRGARFTVKTYAGEAVINLRMVGKFNVYNALGAIAAALAEGIPLEQIRNSLERVKGVDGRVEIVDAGQDYLVLVDYAHTPDGLENVLSTIREFAEGRVLCVFGCGGDRDRTKRPIMGAVAAKYSDYVWVTSDNPRSEDPEAILKEIEPGLIGAGYHTDQYKLIADRRKAIGKAVDMAGPKDVVLIAGKGHETYQIIKGVETFFDDRQEARKAIRSLLDD